MADTTLEELQQLKDRVASLEHDVTELKKSSQNGKTATNHEQAQKTAISSDGRAEARKEGGSYQSGFQKFKYRGLVNRRATSQEINAMSDQQIEDTIEASRFKSKRKARKTEYRRRRQDRKEGGSQQPASK